jgi:hypothetical protein
VPAAGTGGWKRRLRRLRLPSAGSPRSLRHRTRWSHRHARITDGQRLIGGLAMANSRWP